VGVTSSPQLLGRYAIYGKIASGGMASVHFGRLLGGAGFARTVAIKRLHPHLAEDPEFLSTMIDEARLAARIHHPNVVPTLDVVAMEGELLLVMEYVRGESLAHAVKAQVARGARVPFPIVSAIVAGALYGLDAAHEATSDQGEPLGIVHRDVSPQNILVGTDGMARVIDFGVAKAAGRLQTTREGTVKGKIAYMAPEQLAARDVTRTADVYAMGVILWELLTCKRLFVGESDAALVGTVVAGVKDPPSRYVPSIYPPIDALVMKALSPDPDDRFPTARAMAEELTRLLPPALPAEVGAWVSDVAREPLARRGAVLADIESQTSASGVVPAAVEGTKGEVRASQPSVTGPAATPDDVVATMASQPSSVSLETPTPSRAVKPRFSRTQRAAVAGGATLLVAGVLAFALAGRPRGTGATTADEGPSRPSVAAEPPASATTLPSATGTAPDQPPATAASSLPVAPAGNGTSHTPVGATPRTTAAEPPRAKAGCTPPYEFDAQGKKHWKRQCL
jgi:serine/threonine-protein kinase